LPWVAEVAAALGFLRLRLRRAAVVVAAGPVRSRG